MALSFRDLQLLAENEYSVEETRKDLNRLTDFFRAQEYHTHAIEVVVGQVRKLSLAIADEQKIFFVDESISVLHIPEDLRPEALGMVKGSNVVFSGRLVYPVMDVYGNVMGFCGWDKFAKPKYLDSKNYGYKAKTNILYGMEKLPEYYKNTKPVYVVEGIVCCLYLRSIGLQSVAVLGSYLTGYVIEILRRMETKLIVIPDNDTIGKHLDEINIGKPAGEGFVKQTKKALPRARVIQSILAKDVDDTRLLDDGKYEEQFKKDLEMVGVNPFMPFSTIRVR